MTRCEAILAAKYIWKDDEKAVKKGKVECHVDGQEEHNGLDEEHLERFEDDALDNSA